MTFAIVDLERAVSSLRTISPGPRSPGRWPLRPLGLGCLAVLAQLGQRGGQLAAGADAELGEYLAQVPLDRARGQEQPGADLRIGQAVARQPGDVGLLRGQRGDGLDVAP